MLQQSDLIASSRQDKNAGNSGDLVKHSAYLALFDTLTSVEPWRESLHVVEAHAGKGVYVSTSPHFRDFQSSSGFALSRLGRAQCEAFRTPPDGVGVIAYLAPDERPYAGSAMLHALALARLSSGALTLHDSDAGVRSVLERVFGAQALAPLRDRITVVTSAEDSAGLILADLQNRRHGQNHTIHFDPFAFVMSADHEKVRGTYRRLVTESDRRVADDELGAVSVFFTWGSNSKAAREDLDGSGYLGGLSGGYRELLAGAGESRRVLVTWCWTYYFGMLFVVPAALRGAFLENLRAALAPLMPFLSRLHVI